LAHAFIDKLKSFLNRVKRFELRDLILDQKFVIRTCKNSGIDSIDPTISEDLNNQWVERTERLGLNEEQLFAEICNNVSALYPATYHGIVNKVTTDVQKEAGKRKKPWDPATVRAVACGIIAKYHIKAMKGSGLISF